MKSKEELIAIAKRVAKTVGVDQDLFCALCHHESDGWKWAAMRYEPAFFRRYVEPLGFGATESIGRATSWGLGQIMGQTAREFGFRGEFLSELLDPETGCLYAARKLKACINSTSDVRAALLRYNGSGNPQYATLVLRYLPEYKQENQ